jgi:hypothetical protein
MNEEERKKSNKAEPEFTVRYSRNFLRTEAKEKRRSMFIGGIVVLLGAIGMIVEGVHAWRTNSLVDMGPRSGFAKYPPELVIPMGLLGLAIGAYGIWIGVSTRVPSDSSQDDS